MEIKAALVLDEILLEVELLNFVADVFPDMGGLEYPK